MRACTLGILPLGIMWADEGHVRGTQQVERLDDVVAQHVAHVERARELASHRRGAPDVLDGGIGDLVIGSLLGAARQLPGKPLERIIGRPGHVVVHARPTIDAQGIVSPGQKARLRKCALILGIVFLAEALLGHGGNARLLKRVPLAPVTQASQLHIRDERVLARPIAERRDSAGMGRPERGVGIIGRIPFTVLVVVVRPIAGLLVKPLGDVAMGLVAGDVAHEAQHGMLALGTPAGDVVFLL